MHVVSNLRRTLAMITVLISLLEFRACIHTQIQKKGEEQRNTDKPAQEAHSIQSGQPPFIPYNLTIS